MNRQCCHGNTEHVREPCARCVCRLLAPSISQHLSVSFHPLQRSLALSRPNRPGNGSPLPLPCQLPAAPVVSGGERDNDITLAGLTVLILHFSCLSMTLFLSSPSSFSLSLLYYSALRLFSYPRLIRYIISFFPAHNHNLALLLSPFSHARECLRVVEVFCHVKHHVTLF